MDRADDVLLVGGPGTVQALEHHRRRARFFSTVELVNQLEQEKVGNKTGRLAHRLAHMEMAQVDQHAAVRRAVRQPPPLESAIPASGPREDGPGGKISAHRSGVNH